MGKILFGIIVAAASVMLVEPLVCNECNYGLAGYCLKNTEKTCATDETQCFSKKATIPSISSTLGFHSLGCYPKTAPAGEPACDKTGSSTVLGIKIETAVDCCTGDKCNTVQLSGAPSTKMTLTATIAAAILASMCGSLL